MLCLVSDESGSLREEVSSKSFNSLVKLTWVLRLAIFHLNSSVPGADNVEILGLGNTGPSLALFEIGCFDRLISSCWVMVNSEVFLVVETDAGGVFGNTFVFQGINQIAH